MWIERTTPPIHVTGKHKMPMRRKSRSSPRRSLRRSKSRSKSPRRRSSGKARRAAVTRRSPKRRTYKGTRLYGATGNSLQERVNEAKEFAKILGENTSKGYEEALASILDPEMSDEEAKVLWSLLSDTEPSHVAKDQRLEFPKFTLEEADQALRLLNDENLKKKVGERRSERRRTKREIMSL